MSYALTASPTSPAHAIHPQDPTRTLCGSLVSKTFKGLPDRSTCGHCRYCGWEPPTGNEDPMGPVWEQCRRWDAQYAAVIR